MSKMTESELQRLASEFVRREVICCVSGLVSTLAGGANSISDLAGRDLVSLGEQAMELAAPIPDYEEAAIQEGWAYREVDGVGEWACVERDGAMIYDTAQEVCDGEQIDPYEREVFEHWAVSPWLADKLIAQGEKVDKDFAGLCVWARTTTGQGISSDGVIQRIAKAIVEG